MTKLILGIVNIIVSLAVFVFAYRSKRFAALFEEATKRSFKLVRTVFGVALAIDTIISAALIISYLA